MVHRAARFGRFSFNRGAGYFLDGFTNNLIGILKTTLVRICPGEELFFFINVLGRPQLCARGA